MSLSIIVAMARNRVIGKNNQLPWHLPEDLKHFKETTMGHPIVMGRKTFESIGRPLPGRDNIVLTRNRDFSADGITVVADLDEAIELHPDKEMFVIGGEQIYQLVMPRASKLYLTLIDRDIDGDAFFPEIDFANEFHITHECDWMISEKQDLPYRFVIAVRQSLLGKRLGGVALDDQGI